MDARAVFFALFVAVAAAAPARELNFGAPPPDVDECLVDNGGCTHCCTNYDYLVFEYSYKCSCPEGYSLLEDDHSCVQLEACGTHGCSHFCAETPGMDACIPAPDPVCSCPGCTTPGMFGDGHVLGADGKTCLDVNECASGNGGCSQICINTPGCYECACQDFCSTPGLNGDGYVLGNDAHTCFDVNECLFNNGGCSDFCTNLPGCFECSCPPGCADPELPVPAGGYTLVGGTTCVDVDECSAAGWSGACRGNCENTPGCYECISADVETDYKMTLTLIMHDYLVGYMNEGVFIQMVADEIGIGSQYVQVDSIVQAGPDTEVGFTWFALDAQSFVTLLLHVENDIDWEAFLIDYMIMTLPSGGGGD